MGPLLSLLSLRAEIYAQSLATTSIAGDTGLSPSPFDLFMHGIKTYDVLSSSSKLDPRTAYGLDKFRFVTRW